MVLAAEAKMEIILKSVLWTTDSSLQSTQQGCYRQYNRRHFIMRHHFKNRANVLKGAVNALHSHKRERVQWEF